MSGELTTKLLVLLAGLIAVGACASELLFDPAVEEAREEGVLDDVGGNRTGAVTEDGLLVDPDRPVPPVLADDAAVATAETTAETTVVAPVLADDPERAVIPGVVTWCVLIAALILVAWVVVTPAASLGRPSLIAGACVLVGVLLAWGLGAAGVSPYGLDGTALTAWVSVGLSLIAAWVVADVLSRPDANEGIPA